MVTYDGDRVITGTDIDGYMTFEASINHMEIMRIDNFRNISISLSTNVFLPQILTRRRR